MDAPLILREDRDSVRTLTLNRPNAFNALSMDMVQALFEAVSETAADESVRVVVLAADGRAFCAGHDLKEINAQKDRDFCHELFRRFGEVMVAMTRMPQPVIARVHGLTTAAGCQLVAQCDLAVAAQDTRFATSGVSVGLFCSAPGVAVVRNMPRKPALEMLLTGDFIDAEAALELGLLNRVVPTEELDDAVQELADKIIAKPARAIALGKQAFYRQSESTLQEAYAIAAEAMADTVMTEDTQAGIDAFVGKRPMPEWKGR
ncbi:enoyl-CoA hydratase [Magnetospira sp. QH-2]|uniref:enoyl-CoA hydratase n=1 Tax=Magnetospira sp. (strain QH-2) TaxID=1288970 RepID=UPI0003E81069|nr:enoyl-CoA hydratase [Magnetospira sp. QH-2]CCQ73681.1 Enoyl-CoA hydratase [Magnetospira sp. QH-2]